MKRPEIINRGPTADEMQPPKRRDPLLFYAENLIEIFDDPKGTGAAKCARGVELEIASVVGDTLSTDGGDSRRIFLSFLDPRTGKRIEFIDPKSRKAKYVWYACNQTAKKALADAFGTRHVINWIGWVSLRVEIVDNQLKKERVPAIRFSNRLPDKEPTFDYARSLQKRLAELNKTAGDSADPPPPPPPDLAAQIGAQMERSASAEFTSDPDEGAES